MSKTYIPIPDRRLVRERAAGRCEYCLIHEDDAAFRHEVDHIIAEKHGGETTTENLAYACFLCNNSKGSDIASFGRDGSLARFYNPRTNLWNLHFRLDGDEILPLTSVGEATEQIFAFNSAERRLERRGLQELGRYPTNA